MVDYFNVSYKLNTTKPVPLFITGSDGTRIMSFENVNSGDRISLGALISGVYMVTITNPEDKKQYTTRFIKK